MQANRVRTAQAMADYANSGIAFGPPITRQRIYQMVADGQIKVFRFGQKKAEIWTTTDELDRAFSGERDEEVV